MLILSRILLVYITLTCYKYSASSGIAPDLGLSHFAKLVNSGKTSLEASADVAKVEEKTNMVDVVDTETEVFIAGDNVITKDEFVFPGVAGGWYGRDVLPYKYDPMEECQVKGQDGELRYLYCPALQKDGNSTYCCGTKEQKYCCTSAEWMREKDEKHSYDDLPTWAIVLIVIGGLLLAGLLVWVFFCIFCKVAKCLCCSLTHIFRCLCCCCCKDDHNDEERVVLVKETHIHPPPVYNTVTTQDLYQNVTPRNQIQNPNLYPTLPTAPQYPPPYQQ